MTIYLTPLLKYMSTKGTGALVLFPWLFCLIKAQVILYSGESLIAQRTPLEMACI